MLVLLLFELALSPVACVFIEVVAIGVCWSSSMFARGEEEGEPMEDSDGDGDLLPGFCELLLLLLLVELIFDLTSESASPLVIEIVEDLLLVAIGIVAEVIVVVVVVVTSEDDDWIVLVLFLFLINLSLIISSRICSAINVLEVVVGLK